jgi:hypothetical protein
VTEPLATPLWPAAAQHIALAVLLLFNLRRLHREQRAE